MTHPVTTNVVLSMCLLVVLLASPSVAVVDHSVHRHGHAGAMEPTTIDFAASPQHGELLDRSHEHEDVVMSDVEFPRFSTVSTTNLSAPLSYSDACMDLPFAVCVGSVELGGITPIAADSLLKGIVGQWSFDDHAAQDNSGHMNTPKPTPDFGPGFGLSGYSAHLLGTQAIQIDHQPAYSSKDLSVMFWVFVIDDIFGGYHTLLHKGPQDQGAPSIQVIPDSRRIHISVSTSSGESTFDSVGYLPLRRWTHVALVQDHRLLSLYLNGILDKEHIVPEPGVLPNKAPLYIGKDPWRPGVHCFMDDLKIFDRAVTQQDLSSVGWSTYPAMGPTFAKVGCSNCALSKAKDEACRGNYHLCTKSELRQGAMQIAAGQGWIKLSNTHVWHATSKIEDNVHNFEATALCCAN